MQHYLEHPVTLAQEEYLKHPVTLDQEEYLKGLKHD